MQRNDVIGRVLGIVVFLAGVGLLVFVFSLAYGFFSVDVMGQTAKAATEPVATQMGRSAMGMLSKIGFLIVMTIVGSLVAGRGVQLYFASGGRRITSAEPTPSGTGSLIE